MLKELKAKIFSTSENSLNTLIIGGTGTLGKALLRQMADKPHLVTVISRDELKQKEAAKEFPWARFVLADVRDIDSMAKHFRGKNLVFHLAAMKHVEQAEANPDESIKINLSGSVNVAELAMAEGVDHCVLSSTDKAVLPINTYGMCKALSEQYFFDANRYGITKFSVFRWGNVLGSRGSAIHGFAASLLKDKTINITDPRMTRFWIDIDIAAKFMMENYDCLDPMRPLIPKMGAKSVLRVAELVAMHLGIRDFSINITGIRPGEKIHECIYSDHDHCLRSDTAEQISDDEIMAMIGRVLY